MYQLTKRWHRLAVRGASEAQSKLYFTVQRVSTGACNKAEQPNQSNELNSFQFGLIGLPLFAATEEEAEGIAALGIDPLAILLHTGTFLILFFLIKKYALQKIVDGLDGRRRKIEESLKTAEEIEKRDRANREETEKLLKEARTQADEVLAKAHEESGSIIKAAEAVAGAKADKIVKDAQTKLDADIIKAKKELKSEMLALVAQATETVIDEKLDDRKDHALLEKALKGEK